MAKYALVVDFQPGVAETPMEEWKPEEVTAHPDYYAARHRALVQSSELVESEVLSPPNPDYRAATSRTTNLAEQRYLAPQAARLASSLTSPV